MLGHDCGGGSEGESCGLRWPHACRVGVDGLGGIQCVCGESSSSALSGLQPFECVESFHNSSAAGSAACAATQSVLHAACLRMGRGRVVGWASVQCGVWWEWGQHADLAAGEGLRVGPHPNYPGVHELDPDRDLRHDHRLRRGEWSGGMSGGYC